VKRVHWLVLILSLALAVGAAACGGDDDDDDSEAAAEEATAQAECDGEAVTYQLGFVPNAQYAGFLLAVERGYFEEEGVDLTLKPSGPTANPTLQLAQGNIDMTDIPLSEGLNAVAGGANIKLVAQTAQQNPIRYVTMKDIPLDEPADLEGRVIEIQQAGGLTPELRVLLGSVGLSEDDVTVKQGDFLGADWFAGRTEVFPYRIYGHENILASQGIDYPKDVNVLDPNEYGAGVADEGVWVNGDFLSDNSAAVTCVLRAAIRGWEDAIADPEAAKAAVNEAVPPGSFTKADVDVNTDATLEYVQTTPEGEKVKPLTIDMAYIEDSAQKMSDVGVVEGEVNLDEVIVPEPLEQAGGDVIGG
jgi:NitT/TauT family transport system substrate-binding protein